MTATPSRPIADARPAAPLHRRAPIQVPAARVLVATINRAAGTTGVHTHTRVLARGLRDAGIGCEIVTPFDGSRAWLAIFAVRPLLLRRINKTWGTLWYRRWHAAALRLNLRRAMRTFWPTQVIAQDPVSARAAMEVLKSLGKADVPVTLVCHFNHSEAAEYRGQGELASEHAYAAMLRAEEETLRDVSRVVYVSNWARNTVEQDRGIQPRASAVIPNGIEPITAGPAPRASIGLAASDVVLMSVGTLEPRKNQIAIIDLLARIVTVQPAAKLVLVGEGPDRAAIEAKAKALGVDNHLVLLGYRQDVPSLLPLADVYVHYATAENCPMAVLEAARAGLPWAAVASAGVAELQERLGGCVPLDPADLDASLERMVPMLTDAFVRQCLGAAAQSNFARQYTQPAMVRAYADTLGIKLHRDAAAGAN